MQGYLSRVRRRQIKEPDKVIVAPFSEDSHLKSNGGLLLLDRQSTQDWIQVTNLTSAQAKV